VTTSIRTQSIPPKLNQNRLHRIISLPVGQARELFGVDRAISLVNTRQVDLADELNGRGHIWILGAAMHFYRVDAILVYALLAFPKLISIEAYRGRGGRQVGCMLT